MQKLTLEQRIGLRKKGTGTESATKIVVISGTLFQRLIIS